VNVQIIVADYLDAKQACEISALLNAYAQDPMGGGKALDPNVVENLAANLATVPNALSILCYVDDAPAGLANCFVGYSTFKCKPLINVHDIYVAPAFRGHGLSHRLLAKVEEIAVERDCCKITLEVLEGNEPAKRSYLKFGFAGYELDPQMGKALFWEKGI